MAESGDEPTMEIRVHADWTEFDQQANIHQQRANAGGFDPTFSNEGAASSGGSWSRRASMGGGVDRAGEAAERLARALDSAAQAASRASRGLPPGGAIIPWGGGGGGGWSWGGGGGGGGGGDWTWGGGGGRRRALPPPGQVQRVTYEGEEVGGGGRQPPDDFEGSFNSWQEQPSYPPNRPFAKPDRRKGGISDFYRRFLLIEGIRAAADLGYAYRQHEIQTVQAQGNMAALAQADIGFREAVGSSLPFGVGKWGVLLRDPFGQEELGVSMPLLQAQMTNQGTQARERWGMYRRGVAQSAEMAATPMGLGRRLLGIEQTYQNTLISNRAASAAISAQSEAEFQAGVANYQNTPHLNAVGRWLAERGSNFFAYSFIGRQDASEVQAVQANMYAEQADRRRAIAGQLRTADAAATQEREANTQIARREVEIEREDRQRRGDYLISTMTPYAATRTGLLSREALEQEHQRQDTLERSSLINRQSREMAEIRLRSPELEGEVWAEQTAEFNALAYQQGRAQVIRNLERAQTRRMLTIRAEGSGPVSAARAGNRPFEAAILQQSMENRLAFAEADPEDREQVAQMGWQAMQALIAIENRRRQAQSRSMRGQIQTTQALISHDPLGARQAQLEAERDVALIEAPADNPAARQMIQDIYAGRLQLVAQQYRERRYMEYQGLQRELDVTNLMGQAVGPGAAGYRLQAHIREITGAAEEKAEGRLLEDQNNMRGADYERQIGIGRLRELRANYLENFRVGEGSVFRTAFQGTGAANPTEILERIANGINELTQKIGTLVAVD